MRVVNLIYLTSLVCLGTFGISNAFIPVSSPAVRRSRPVGAGPQWLKVGQVTRSSSRLYGRLTERPGDKSEQDEAGEALPKLDDEVPKLTKDQEAVSTHTSSGPSPPHLILMMCMFTGLINHHIPSCTVVAHTHAGRRSIHGCNPTRTRRTSRSRMGS